MNAPPEQLRSACLLDGIELGEEIGRGRSATVWSARWEEREVAVKVLEPAWEGREPSPPAHPSILDVLARGEALGRRYFVLPRFPSDLSGLLGGRPLSAGLRRAVLVPLLDAVEHAHRRGVVHGDIKPANVLVDPAARPVRVALADFGHGPPVAELEASILSAERDELDSGVSTLPYLAPERIAGGAPSPAADVYALGVLLFELLTGRLPIGLELPSELERGIDPRLDRVVKLAMARRAGERPAIAELRRELLRVLGRPAGERAPAAPDEMVRIPGGFVVIGDREDPDARPMHEVRLEPFWVDRTPVTNEAYHSYVQTTGARRPRTWPRGRLPRRLLAVPVSGVTWREARAYAEWAGKRLLTELEWERAAQGPEHRPYPYGEELDLARIHADPRRLAPVDAHPGGASSEGVADLTGNGWEWTASVFAPYGVPAPEGEQLPRSIRGGYDPARPRSASATCRVGLRPDVCDPGVTFRCGRSP